MKLIVRLTPRAGREGISGLDEHGRLRVSVSSPPVDGKANAALVHLLAKALGVASSRVILIRGLHPRDKTVEVPVNLATMRALATGGPQPVSPSKAPQGKKTVGVPATARRRRLVDRRSAPGSPPSTDGHRRSRG